MTQEDWLIRLSEEPKPEHIKKNDDGSLYVPISITQSLLDELFLGQWNFEQVREVFGKTHARGYGRMEATTPFGVKIVRGGDAGIVLTGNLRTDSPRLEAMVLLSCARKFGKVFGRDLNRNKDDEPLQTTQVRENLVGDDLEWEQVKAKLKACKSREEAQEYIDTTNYKLTIEAKQIINTKKPKNEKK